MVMIGYVMLLNVVNTSNNSKIWGINTQHPESPSYIGGSRKLLPSAAHRKSWAVVLSGDGCCQLLCDIRHLTFYGSLSHFVVIPRSYLSYSVYSYDLV